MRCADFPRHLGRQIFHCLVAHPEGADTVELAAWSYGEGPHGNLPLGQHPVWYRWNVIRHCRMWGIKPIGKRGRRYLWALHKLDD
jgi:hypothetical protein